MSAYLYDINFGIGRWDVFFEDDDSTAVRDDGAVIWHSPSPLSGPAGNWVRNAGDLVWSGDIDGDHRDEVIVFGPSNWSGVFRWQSNALQPVWMRGTAIDGPNNSKWIRNQNDRLLVTDLDGDGAAEAVIIGGNNWTGVLKWMSESLQVIWEVPSPITGPAGDWVRSADDGIWLPNGLAKDEIAIVNGESGWRGILQWQGGRMETVSITPPTPPPPPPPPVNVPNLIGLREDVAIDRITAAGLGLEGVNGQAFGVPANQYTVTAQSPTAGSTVKHGTGVYLTVARTSTSGTSVMSLRQEGPGSFNYTAQFSDATVPNGAVVAGVTNSSGHNYTLAHGGPGSGYYILNAGQTAHVWDGQAPTGSWSAQFSGQAVDLPNALSVSIAWRA